MTKIPKGSDVGDRMNLWYYRCNFNHPTLQNGSNAQDFSRILCRIHKLSNKYKLVENGIRSKEIRAKYGRAYDSTR
jgi:hypothetical protein